MTRVPDGLDKRSAGALGLAGTAAHDSVNAVDQQQGETILISGATGGVGALAVQLAASRGARIIATARPGTEADFVAGLTDAEIDVVDYSGDLEAQVRAIAPGELTRYCTWPVTATSSPACYGPAGASPPPSSSSPKAAM